MPRRLRRAAAAGNDHVGVKGLARPVDRGESAGMKSTFLRRVIWFLVGLAALARIFMAQPARADELIVAGGCFWCVESDFDRVTGVTATTSGYTGGTLANPAYDDLKDGGTGHYEAVRIAYDPAVITHPQLLRLFLRSIDPTDAGGQFCDRGDSYRTAIFVDGEAARAAAEQALAEAEMELGQRIVTPILPVSDFWPAEDYHQDFHSSGEIILTRRGPMAKRNAYDFYRESCGRDARVRELWGDAAAFAK
jgi:peptide-methionine (S)-S-oxide reductase